jgi:hypothetical protein
MPIAGKILTFIASIAVSYAIKKVFERGLAMLKTPTQNQIRIVDDNYDTILSFGPAYMIFVNK